MRGRETIVVVGETPSLAGSLTDLLESDGFAVTTVHDPIRELTHSLRDPAAKVGLVVSASNCYRCETARRWMRGEVAGVDLIVVGCRDPELRPGPRVHVVGLPLAPEEFLLLVRRLLGRPSRTLPARRISNGSRRVRSRPPPAAPLPPATAARPSPNPESAPAGEGAARPPAPIPGPASPPVERA